METKHTKGEWILSYPEINKHDEFNIKDEDGFILAQVFGANGTPLDMEESEANAKLMIVAPELLKVLIDLTQTKFEVDSNHNIVMRFTQEQIDNAEKAIKKAIS